MRKEHFKLYVSYSQIVVCDSPSDNPFNHWTPQHHKQGFSWRKGSVSFGTFFSADACIDASVENSLSIVEIACVEERAFFDVPRGNYALLYECRKIESESLWCGLSL